MGDQDVRYASVADAARQADILQRVLNAISSGLALEPLLTSILESAVSMIDATHGTIGLVEARAGQPLVRKVAVVNMSPEELGAEMQAGAQGYLLKDLRALELLHAIHLAAEGQMVLHGEAQQQLLKQINEARREPTHSRLMSRERDVLRLIVGGLSNKQIAYQLGLTEGTVKGYVSAILEKLWVEDRTQAALYAVKHGLA